jgi:hypothetical protein
VTRRIVAAAVIAVSLVGTLAWAGHELPVYPSYYPHEIDIRTVAPESALDLIERSQIQAYVGAVPPQTALPDSVGAVESLGSYIVITVDRDSQGDPCAATAAAIDELSRNRGDLVFHPYPVTPLHGDYLYQADLAVAAKELWNSRIRTTTSANQTGQGDAAVTEIDAGALQAQATTLVNGWIGPPWLRKGWFQADLLLGDAAIDPAVKARASADVERLTTEDYEDAVERINLERDLVGLLTGGCHKTVAGYTVRHRYYNNDYSAGIENIAYDSITGFASPMFLRTAKLKDFPWNGWLRLGTAARPTAAWNPVAGFTDEFGRLMWSALGDPAALPAPNDSGWTINRIADVTAIPAR